MEERLIDDERQIKIKRKREGADVVDALAEDTEEEIPEEELILELPEGDEYDEDLVGLTPSQLKEELARRQRALEEAREESEKLTAAGEEKLALGEAEEAEGYFEQAVFYNPENVAAGKGLWQARTKNFKNEEAFFEGTNAEELNAAPEEVRAYVLERAGNWLKSERKKCRAEEQPLAEQVEAKQEERRAPFLANRKYYLLRFGICFAAFALLLIGSLVSASYIFTTRSALPVGLCAGFGAAALVALVCTILFTRKLVVAQRLCRDNEELSSTEEGVRLKYLQERLRCLDLILGEE